MMRLPAVLLVVAVVALTLSACGRKGGPQAPEGSFYPRPYPDLGFPGAPAAATVPGGDETMEPGQPLPSRPPLPGSPAAPSQQPNGAAPQ